MIMNLQDETGWNHTTGSKIIKLKLDTSLHFNQSDVWNLSLQTWFYDLGPWILKILRPGPPPECIKFDGFKIILRLILEIFKTDIFVI